MCTYLTTCEYKECIIDLNVSWTWFHLCYQHSQDTNKKKPCIHHNCTQLQCQSEPFSVIDNITTQQHVSFTIIYLSSLRALVYLNKAEAPWAACVATSRQEQETPATRASETETKPGPVGNRRTLGGCLFRCTQIKILCNYYQLHYCDCSTVASSPPRSLLKEKGAMVQKQLKDRNCKFLMRQSVLHQHEA